MHNSIYSHIECAIHTHANDMHNSHIMLRVVLTGIIPSCVIFMLYYSVFYMIFI